MCYSEKILLIKSFILGNRDFYKENINKEASFAIVDKLSAELSFKFTKIIVCFKIMTQ